MEGTYFNAACRRNGEVGPIPSITRKLWAVKKPMPWISSASRYGFRGQAPRRQGPYTSRTRRASALPRPIWRTQRVNIGNRGDGGERVVNGTRALRCDALDCAQLPRLYADHSEDAVAEPLDGFSGTARTKVPGARNPE